MPNNTLADSEVDDRTEPMTPLDALKAALEAKREAEAALRRPVPGKTDADFALGRRYPQLRDDLHDLLTDDTIAALIAVAERSRISSVCVCGKVWRYENHAHAEDCPLAPLVKEENDCPSDCPGPCVIGCDGDAYGNRSQFEG